MHANQTHTHSPCWVGGLMDPVFLRHAVNDAEGDCHADDPSPSPMWANWQAALQSVAAFFSRRSSGQ
jgi:hypothetical protein